MNDTIKKIIHEHQEESHQLSFYFDFDQDNHHIRFSANASRLTIVSLLQDLIHSILRKQNTTTRRIYITTMYRYANRESHSYVTYAGFSRETAIQRGWGNKGYRGGKYYPEVVSFIPEIDESKKIELRLQEGSFDA